MISGRPISASVSRLKRNVNLNKVLDVTVSMVGGFAASPLFTYNMLLFLFNNNNSRCDLVYYIFWSVQWRTETSAMEQKRWLNNFL